MSEHRNKAGRPKRSVVLQQFCWCSIKREPRMSAMGRKRWLIEYRQMRWILLRYSITIHCG